MHGNMNVQFKNTCYILVSLRKFNDTIWYAGPSGRVV